MPDDKDINIENSYVTEYSKLLAEYVSSLAVKREDLAFKFESLISSQNFDYYRLAVTETDRYNSYAEFSREMMLAAGLTFSEIEDAQLNLQSVPESKQTILLEMKRKEVIDNYVETNNYYRMLMGMPAIDDYLEIRITNPVQGVDIRKNIWEMSNDEIAILRSLGYISNLVKEYPTRPYLRYLGSQKINFMQARLAKRFEILRFGESDNPKLIERFNINYEYSRAYILNNYYRKRKAIDQEYFDAYIGFIIMVNTLVMTANDSIDVFNAKEYFNELIIKQILQSFNLDIFDDIPLVYRKEVAFNMESLIVSKGTNEVIYKIFKIFGLDDVTVRKFMLVKEHKMDAEGNYIFSYDQSGKPNYEEMYDVNFSSIDIDTQNIDAEIRKGENKLDYYTVAGQDKYWGGYESDEQVRQRALQENSNYTDTDYISINTAYSLTDLTTEVSYFFSLLYSLKPYMTKLTMLEPFYSYTTDVFYMMTMVSALISKRNLSDGVIVTNPADLAYIYKFNFERSLSDITDILKRHQYNAKAEDFMTPILNNEVLDTNTLVNLYFDNRAVMDRLIQIMVTTKDINEYMTMKELVDYLTKSKLSSDIFRKSNGEVASTYIDFLKDGNPTLGDYIENLAYEDIHGAIFKILNILEDYFVTDRFKYIFIKIPNLMGEDTLKRYMMKVINTFKAYSINIFSMSISYNIDNPNSGNIRILDDYYVDHRGATYQNISILDTLSVAGNGISQTNIKIRDELNLIQ